MKLFGKILLFLCCLLSLLISMQIFYNQGIVTDAFSLSASQLFGGWFWLYMNWLRLLLLFAACIISFLHLIKKPTQP